MKPRAALTGGLAVLLLSACSGLVEGPPAAPSAADFNQFHARMLELTWDGFAYPPALSAPPVRPVEGLDPAAWGTALHSCMEAAGYPDFGYSWSNSEGYVLLTVRREAVFDRAEMMAFYFCVAEHPLLPGDNGMLVSAGQLEYVYDYYARWTVPCLIDHGYKLRRMLSRQDFIAAMGEWAPYWELPIYSEADLDRVVALCGPYRPPLSPELAVEARS